METDESDRSFLEVRPEIAVVTEVGLEHVQTYPTRRDVRRGLRRVRLGCTAGGRLRSTGRPARAAVAPASTGGGWRWRWAVPGEHNARNAVCGARGLPRWPGPIPARCAADAGRLSRHGEALRARRNDPRRARRSTTTTAAHPTEIRATLAAAQDASTPPAGRGAGALGRPASGAHGRRLPGRARPALTGRWCSSIHSPRDIRAEQADVTAEVIAEGSGARGVRGRREEADAERRLGDELGARATCAWCCARAPPTSHGRLVDGGG